MSIKINKAITKENIKRTLKVLEDNFCFEDNEIEEYRETYKKSFIK